MIALNHELPEDAIMPVSVASAQALARSMDETGVAVLGDVLPQAVLGRLRNWVAELIERQGARYFGFYGEQWIASSCLAPLFEDPGLRALMRQLYERKMGGGRHPATGSCR